MSLSEKANKNISGILKFLKTTKAEKENELEAINKEIRYSESQLLCEHDLQFHRKYGVYDEVGNVYKCTKCGVTIHDTF